MSASFISVFVLYHAHRKSGHVLGAEYTPFSPLPLSPATYRGYMRLVEEGIFLFFCEVSTGFIEIAGSTASGGGMFARAAKIVQGVVTSRSTTCIYRFFSSRFVPMRRLTALSRTTSKPVWQVICTLSSRLLVTVFRVVNKNQNRAFFIVANFEIAHSYV